MLNRPLRFCMITTFYPPYNFGGDGIFVRRLSNELARRGHQVDVIHCVDAYRLLAPKRAVKDQQNHPNITVHGIKSRFGFLSPLATQQTGYPLFKSSRIRQILEKNFDVIHYHNTSLIGGPGILEYGQGIKLYTMHEYWLVCPTHVLFKFNRRICARKQCLLCSLIYKRPPQWWRYSGLLKSAIRHVDAFIAPSRFTEEKHRQLGPDVRIVHLPYFISPPENPRPDLEDPGGDAPEGPYFLFVGRLEKLKGLQTIIPVFRRYRSRHGRPKLLVAGKGNYERRLRRLAGGDADIRFLGHVSGRRLDALYQNAVAVIVPSLCFDVSPQVVMEAFMQGTPVIAGELGGTPEFIEQSGGGFVYRSEEQLRSAIDRLLADPAYRDQLGRRGFQAYQRLWTADAHMSGYLGLIDEIGRRKHPGEWV